MHRGQLRDRARVLRKTKEKGQRTDGGYVTREPAPGPWFRCHYERGDTPEVRGPGSVRRRETAAQLVTHRRALDGSEIEIKASDRIEVDSLRYGTVTLDIAGEPERLVHGRTWTGWLVPIAKVKRDAPG